MNIADNFYDLIDKIKDSNLEERDIKKYLDALSENMNHFLDYFNQVVKMEIFVRKLINWDNTNEFMYKKMDEERQLLHNICISTCQNINKLCDKIGCSHFCDFDLEDRHKVAEFCGFVVSDLYVKGINSERSLDSLVEKFAEKGEKAVRKEDIDEWIR